MGSSAVASEIRKQVNHEIRSFTFHSPKEEGSEHQTCHRRGMIIQEFIHGEENNSRNKEH